jgi:hypothetical protein
MAPFVLHFQRAITDAIHQTSSLKQSTYMVIELQVRRALQVAEDEDVITQINHKRLSVLESMLHSYIGPQPIPVSRVLLVLNYFS